MSKIPMFPNKFAIFASILGDAAWKNYNISAGETITIPLARSCIVEIILIGEKYAMYSFNWDNGSNPSCSLISSTENFGNSATVTASLSGLSIKSLLQYSAMLKAKTK